MTHLVYCIMRAPVVNGEPMTGVKGKEVFFVTTHGLCAAVSELLSAENTLPVSELLVYGRVVEELYRMQAVIPMRYGCFLKELSKVQRILEEKNRQYDTLLQELEGRVEMGIRILLPEQAVRPQQGTQPVDGGHYLAMRRTHYRIQDENSRHNQALLDECIQAFSGLYSKHRTDTATSNGSVVLSLYFLIPKNQINRFRGTFRRVIENEVPKALISGPWPPYNFATPDILPGAKPAGAQ